MPTGSWTGHSANSCSSSPEVCVIGCSNCLSGLSYYTVLSHSLSEWKQAQSRDGEGCGDPCEQVIATSKQAEEVIMLIRMDFMWCVNGRPIFSLMQAHVSPTINTIPDEEHRSSANAAHNVVRL